MAHVPAGRGGTGWDGITPPRTVPRLGLVNSSSGTSHLKFSHRRCHGQRKPWRVGLSVTYSKDLLVLCGPEPEQLSWCTHVTEPQKAQDQGCGEPPRLAHFIVGG